MSKYRREIKFEKFSTEAIKNALRLHYDSILLYDNKSYASAFHLSVLTLEEIAKSDWIDHYVETSITNNGLPEPDGEDEQQWVKLLYIHTKKHFAFVNQQYHSLEKSFYNFAKSSKLEYKKQKSIYVGFERAKNKINTKSKISTPNQIKDRDAKQIISLNNQVLINQCVRNINNDFYFGPFDKFEILNYETMLRLKKAWTFKTKLLEIEELRK
jgi:AbiV family abortive infection protein